MMMWICFAEKNQSRKILIRSGLTGSGTNLDIEHETILVKGGKRCGRLMSEFPNTVPIINDALDLLKTEKRPVAVCWGFHDFGQ